MNLSSLFVADAFFWFVVPIALLEGLRAARSEVLLARHSYSGSVAFGFVEATLLALAASTTSPLVFVALGVLRLLAARWRDGGGWMRGVLKLGLVAGAMFTLRFTASIDSFDEIATLASHIDPSVRTVILLLASLACVVAIVPVKLADEAKTTLAAPYTLAAFARVAVPLGVAEPRVALFVPIAGAVLSLICALWLLSAGMRANHFERSTLVSELVVCERGVLLSFVWLGLAAGERLAGVGALLEWWAAAFALLSLEASLRVRALPKAMAFFALAMAVGLPGTTGFVAEDLLAHGLLEMRPLLAAAFVCVGAVNAGALYVAVSNLIVDCQSTDEGRPTPMMLVPAAVSLVVGLMPASFVEAATHAHAVVAHVELPTASPVRYFHSPRLAVAYVVRPQRTSSELRVGGQRPRRAPTVCRGARARHSERRDTWSWTHDGSRRIQARLLRLARRAQARHLRHGDRDGWTVHKTLDDTGREPG